MKKLVYYRELYSISCNKQNGKEYKKEYIYNIYNWITLLCSPWSLKELNTTELLNNTNTAEIYNIVNQLDF